MNSQRDNIFDEANGELAIGELESAITGYRKCLELDPNFFDGWQALGMVLMKTDQLKEAIGCALQAIALQPNDLLVWTALSQMYVANGQIPEAEEAKQNATILSIGGKVSQDPPHSS